MHVHVHVCVQGECRVHAVCVPRVPVLYAVHVSSRLLRHWRVPVHGRVVPSVVRRNRRASKEQAMQAAGLRSLSMAMLPPPRTEGPSP